MPETTPTPADQLDSLIARYVEAVEAGQVPDRQALLESHADLADRLRAFFADFDRLDRVAAPLRPTAEPDATVDQAPASAGALNRVRYFGDYELLEEIAHGGMGIVFKARQTSLNRIVALKMILKGTFATPKEVARFRAEAEAAANLDHPNIVPILEVGEHEGQQYFTMKLIDGRPLHQTEPGPAKEEAERLAIVARAVHYAHQRGILHRDLKPSNILIGEGQGVGPRCPYVADFGLAKRLDAGASITESGALLGTPRYMAPEQATGKKDLTVAADIYSLGVILYERLLGRTPFQGDDVLTLLRQARETEPPRPTSLKPGFDRDLETLLLKCLEKEPAKRYPSAADLAEELERWLKGEPILARPVGQWGRAWRWAKRNPAVSGLTAAVAASLLLGIGLTTTFAVVADRRAEAEEQQRLKAEAAQDGLERTLVRGFLRPFPEGFWDGPNEAKADELHLAPLWELAENRGERVWFRFVEEALREPRTTRQLIGNSQILLHAAVGLDPTKRDQLANYLVAALRDPSMSARHVDLSLLLVSLGGLTAEEAGLATERLLSGFSGVSDQEDNESPSWYVARAIANPAGWVAPDQAALLFDRMLEAYLGEKSHERAEWLLHPLYAVADRLESAAALKRADQLLKLMEAQKESERIAKLDFIAGTLARTDEAARDRVSSVKVAKLCTHLASGSTPDYAAGILYDALSSASPAEARRLAQAAAEGLSAAIAAKFDGRELNQLVRALCVALDWLPKPIATKSGNMVAAKFTTALTANQAWGSGRDDLNGTLKHLVHHIDQDAAARSVERLLDALNERNEHLCWRLTLAIELFALRVNSTAAGRLSDRLVATILEGKSKAHPLHVVEALLAISARTEPSETSKRGRAVAELFSRRLGEERGFANLVGLTYGVGRLASALDEDAASRLCETAANRLADAVAAGGNLNDDGKNHITEVVDYLDAQAAARFADRLFSLSAASPNDASMYTGTLQWLAPRLPPADAAKAAKRILADADNPRHTGFWLRESAPILAALAKRLPHSEAVAVADQIIARIDLSETHGEIEAATAIAEIAEILDRRQAALLCDRALARFRRSGGGLAARSILDEATLLQVLAPAFEATRRDQLLAESMQFVTGASATTNQRVDECLYRADASESAARVGAAMAVVGSPSVVGLTELGLAAEPLPPRFSTEFLVEVLQRPTAVGACRRAVLDSLGTRYRRHFRDQWDFVRFAQEQKLNLDFTAGPKRKLTGVP